QAVAPAARPAEQVQADAAPAAARKPAQTETRPPQAGRAADYYEIKRLVFEALIGAIDVSQLAAIEPDVAREEIRDILPQIVATKKLVMANSEQEQLLQDICNDILGYGPLEPLLARDDIADIMVNGPDRIFIEVDGKVEETGIRFRDER